MSRAVMRANASHADVAGSGFSSGMTLMECVMALAVIAFALPVVMLVLSAAHGGGRDAVLQGEARRAMLSHARELSREGFAENQTRRVWAHDANGRCLGQLDDVAYEQGLRLHEGKSIRYLIVAELDPSASSDLKPLSLRLEHPASCLLYTSPSPRDRG